MIIAKAPRSKTYNVTGITLDEAQAAHDALTDADTLEEALAADCSMTSISRVRAMLAAVIIRAQPTSRPLPGPSPATTLVL